MYCSDVSGAFDKVPATRLLAKLRATGMNNDMVEVIRSWLRNTTAHVVMQGARSSGFTLSDMVFQGTVWGPALWNVYFGDSTLLAQGSGFTVVVYADDYNAFKDYPRSVGNPLVFSELKEYQCELHKWGRGNGVTFDAGKEHCMILSLHDPEGEIMRLLGVDIDNRLTMSAATTKCVHEASWRLRALLRTHRYHTDAELLMLFKAHVLSYLEYTTPAIFHATETVLMPLNRVLRSFLRNISISVESAFLDFNMMPLESRRDVSMLGVIHRSVLGLGPKHFKDWFVIQPILHRRSQRLARNTICPIAEVPSASNLRIGRHSIFGMIRIYNQLPNSVVTIRSVSGFQRALADIMRNCAKSGAIGWPHLYSTRCDFSTSLLRNIP